MEILKSAVIFCLEMSVNTAIGRFLDTTASKSWGFMRHRYLES